MPQASQHHSCRSKLPKSRQSKHQSKAELERYIVVDRTSQINPLDRPVQPIHRYDVVASSRSILFGHVSFDPSYYYYYYYYP